MNVEIRKPGPLAPGGFYTVMGSIDGRPVFWIGGSERADSLEKQYASASRLQKILLRNAYTLQGITPEEYSEATRLIESLPESGMECGCGEQAIGDTNMCRSHCRYALATRN